MIENVCEPPCCGVLESTTEMTKPNVPLWVGVPEIVPPADKESPVGKEEPVGMLQVYGVVPPLTASVVE